MFDGLFLEDLTEAEETALRSYKAAKKGSEGQSLCFDLNKDLRNGLRPNELSCEMRDMLNALDSVFQRCPKLDSGATVFRGIGNRNPLPLHEVGCRFRSFQYWSTSTNETVADNFLIPSTTQGYGAVLKIKLPVEFPAYNMETLDGSDQYEAELLLPRSILWRVENFEIRNVSSYLAEKFINVATVTLTPECWE